MALAIANSPLVKTAIAGEDANWGRIVMAVGKSGAEADRDRLAIRFGDIVVARDGARAPGYSEEAASAYMKGPELCSAWISAWARASATVWTCDLTARLHRHQCRLPILTRGSGVPGAGGRGSPGFSWSSRSP